MKVIHALNNESASHKHAALALQNAITNKGPGLVLDALALRDQNNHPHAERQFSTVWMQKDDLAFCLYPDGSGIAGVLQGEELLALPKILRLRQWTLPHGNPTFQVKRKNNPLISRDGAPMSAYLIASDKPKETRGPALQLDDMRKMPEWTSFETHIWTQLEAMRSEMIKPRWFVNTPHKFVDKGVTKSMLARFDWPQKALGARTHTLGFLPRIGFTQDEYTKLQNYLTDFVDWCWANYGETGYAKNISIDFKGVLPGQNQTHYKPHIYFSNAKGTTSSQFYTPSYLLQDESLWQPPWPKDLTYFSFHVQKEFSHRLNAGSIASKTANKNLSSHQKLILMGRWGKSVDLEKD